MSQAEREACGFIIDLVHRRSGIRLHHGKDALIQARLGKRIRQRGLPGLPEYCAFLRDQADPLELDRAVEALTTNFTSFLRESAHFKFLVEEAVPALARRGDKKLRLWSAACSSGEEPYSIALYLAEHCPATAGWDWRITASDLATKVLDQARSGIYAAERLQAVPPAWLRAHFQKGIGSWAGHYRVKTSLSERIEFRRINLVEPYEHSRPFQVLFCRNMLIYFERPDQQRILRQLCRHVEPGGYVIVGHSESLNGLDLPLRSLRASIYQRI